MKILIIINESLDNMALGRNSTLSYILACCNLKYDVFIFELKNKLPRGTKIKVLHFNKDKNFAQSLVVKHQEINNQIFLNVRENDLQKLSAIANYKLGQFIQTEFSYKLLNLTDFDFIIQRLEPMSAPFPPKGKADINQILKDLKKLFPQRIFNNPLNLEDKAVVLQINKILQEQIATPTYIFKFGNNPIKAIKSAILDYQKIYKSENAKIVFKPKNSAQSVGVFAVEFTENGYNLQSLLQETPIKLKSQQKFIVKNDLKNLELQKIIEILCFVQNSQSLQVLNKIKKSEIAKVAKKLYNDQIYVQPFLEGIKDGDIRVNIFKNSVAKFYEAGATFRKSLRNQDNVDNKFTTAYATGGATSLTINSLTKIEQKNLRQKTAKILHILNNDLHKKYKNSLELGIDFILVGDGENIFLGEINHHCPGLIPISEAMQQAIAENSIYDGGLGFAKKAILDWIKLQEKYW